MGVDEAIEKIANSTPPQQSATQVEPKQSQEILLKRREESRDVDDLKHT